MPTDVTVDIDDDVGGLGIEFVAAHRVAGRWAHVVAVQKRWRCVLIDPDDFVALHDRVAAVAPAALRVPAPVRPRPSLCSKPQRQGRDRRLALSTYLHDLVDLGHPEVTNEVLSLLQANDPSRLSVEQLAGRTDLSTWRDAAGGTLLHYAAGRADHALLDLVLAGDVDGTLPQERDQFGYVAGDVARALGHDDVASRLPAGHDDDERRRRHEVPCQYGIAPGHRRVLVVGNPVSGKGHAASVIEHVVVPLLDAAGIRHETKLTSWPGDAKSIALTFDGDRFDTLLLVSGDGLLHGAPVPVVPPDV